jgi:hypothetical protein
VRFAPYLCLLAVALASCDEGEYEPTGGDDPTIDAAETPNGSGAPGANDATAGSGAGGTGVFDAQAIACEPAIASPGSGNHNAGLACLSCHDGGGDAPTFTMGGTVFSTSSGGAPVVGATIVVVDAAGMERRLVTRTNGNFYSIDRIVFPVRVHATRCPDARAMSAEVPDGNCNACHLPAMRITLP